jgi:hypothetical protein
MWLNIVAAPAQAGEALSTRHSPIAWRQPADERHERGSLAMNRHTGGCRCGAIRFEAKADPFHISYCHCGDCRRASGAPVSAYVGFRSEDVTFSGTVGSTYGASPITRRFCGICGSPVSYSDERLSGQIYMMLGAMDAPENYPPRVHGYVREQLPFFHVDDGLPRMETITVPRSEGAPS